TPFSATAATPQAAARAAVEHAATLLSRQLAYVPQQGSGGTLSVTVSGVASLAAEAAVARLLANVPGVSDAHLASIDADRADFSLRYAGAPSELARALSLSGTLTPEQAAPSAPASGTSAASSGTLYFRYTP
ncbi:MAG TPA: hypothetical protein VFX38_08415, partial [Gammaproteobacteria bacterium]|nr:hypothetical protein [Gammaproteobacteria bacterium]